MNRETGAVCPFDSRSQGVPRIDDSPMAVGRWAAAFPLSDARATLAFPDLASEFRNGSGAS